ncbi:MAG: hypothetical protein B0W54_21165 [Cellvibrio sp. 79]|nr:MAG: hypothetical protein B0W54_21165 [Cellvibrio sp. 79]
MYTKRNTTPNKKIVWLKRILTLFFFILVPVLLFTLIKQIEWHEVKEALISYKVSTLLLCIAIALSSYCIFASYDLIGKKYTGHNIPTRQIIPLGFVCYAFNLNLSSWVGGIALRYRLYTRLGLNVPTITKILSMNLITNWLGYLILAGIIFLFGLINLPDNWKIGTTALQVIGAVMIAVAIFYLVACKYAKRRSVNFFHHKLSLPESSISFLQAGLAILNWSLMGLIIFTLLPQGKVGYPTVLGILLIGAIAGVITHIPAGLGVLETIFITLLQHQLSKGTILAALIGYRVIYFLIPLGIAVIIYLILESRAKKMRATNTKQEMKKAPLTKSDGASLL